MKTVVYSVYDYNKRAYDYYEGMGNVPASGWMRRATSRLRAPESLCEKLPADAMPIGSGKTPRGIIATTDRALAGLSGGSITGGGAGIGALVERKPAAVAGVVGLAAALALWWASKRKT